MLQAKGDTMKDKISVIGAAIVDVLAGPVDKEVVSNGSTPMDTIKMSFGGDALNEAVVMSRLGLDVELITKLGCDDAGEQVTSFISKNGVSLKCNYDDSLETGINIVLVDKEGQRSFLTNPQGSLRKLEENDISVNVSDMGNIVCFASMFVSPLLDVPAMERLFAQIKSTPGRTLVVDMTTAKKGEKLEDLRGLLPYVDYLIPNEVEAERLTGLNDSRESALRFIEAGAGCVIIKCGKDGCFVRTRTDSFSIPAYEGVIVKDTTGAGDSFVAGFVYGLKNGMELADCCRFGCAVSSCVVEEFGAHQGIESVDKPMKRYLKMAIDVGL